MNRFLRASGLALVAHGSILSAAERSATEIYASYCAGCHGERMEGGKGRSLISGEWKHGGDAASVSRSILRGYPGAGMPAFATALSDAETLALVALINETAIRRVDPQPAEEERLPEGIRRSEEHSYRIETVAEGFDVPWSLTFLPDGRILVTERVGRLRSIENGRLDPEPISGIPQPVVKDEAGLMSVVADPDYRANGWLYLSYADPGDEDTAMLKIVRGRLRDRQWVDEETVFMASRQSYQKSHVLFGGRLAFRDGYLFFSVGERGMEEGSVGSAQDLTLPAGKIHRVFPDGSIPPDNPHVDLPGACRSIWACGVRNPQGLAFDSRNGDLWETEHGPRGGDELNRIRRGANYGWPLASYGMNYDGSPITEKTKTEAPGTEQPELYWTPSVAVSELEFYTGDRFPRWNNNLFVGSLAQQKFLRLVVDGGHVVHREEVFSRLGRVRDIKTGPDGLIYLALEFIGKPGRIVRLVPAE